MIGADQRFQEAHYIDIFHPDPCSSGWTSEVLNRSLHVHGPKQPAS
jgi:hypothetical protein